MPTVNVTRSPRQTSYSQLVTRATLHNSSGIKPAHRSVRSADTHTCKSRTTTTVSLELPLTKIYSFYLMFLPSVEKQIVELILSLNAFTLKILHLCCLHLQESPAVADKPARRLRKVCTVYVRAVGL